jgi:hypothetical protein
MINKTNIDVQIYLDQLMEGVNQSGILEIIMEEFEVEKEYLKEIEVRIYKMFPERIKKYYSHNN